jgi:hypothetical protein
MPTYIVDCLRFRVKWPNLAKEDKCSYLLIGVLQAEMVSLVINGYSSDCQSSERTFMISLFWYWGGMEAHH